jgi:hypothetical protein
MTSSPARQSMSSSARPATSAQRSPSRHSSTSIAKSRRPIAVRRSQPASSRFSSTASSGRGSAANRHAPTPGTAPVNERASSPSTCRKPSSDRSAVATDRIELPGRRAASPNTNALTSAAVTRSSSTRSAPARAATNGRIAATLTRAVPLVSARSTSR